MKQFRKVLAKLNHKDYNPLNGIISKDELTLSVIIANATAEEEETKVVVVDNDKKDDENHDCNNNNTKEESKTKMKETDENQDEKQQQDTSTKSPSSPSSSTTSTFTLEYITSQQLQKDETLQQRLLELFECNMKEYYEKSTWGYNPKSKLDEFQHVNAKFLLLHEHKSSNENATKKSSSHIVGFVHFRFEWDDEEYPTEPVLYVYELQIDPIYQRSKVVRCVSSSSSATTTTGKDSTKKATTKNNGVGAAGDSVVSVGGGGFGTYIMLLLEKMAAKSDTTNLNKIVLTCFKSNKQAMDFYLKKLSYVIDDNSPSKHNDPSVDYEILSKTTTTTATL